MSNSASFPPLVFGAHVSLVPREPVQFASHGAALRQLREQRVKFTFPEKPARRYEMRDEPVPPPITMPREAVERKMRMTKAAANKKAMKLVKADPGFTYATAAEWAQQIGCSAGLIANLPMWAEAMRETGRGRGKVSRPKAKAWSAVVEQTERPSKLRAAREEQERRDRLIDQLTAEQIVDYEPSPLDGTPRLRVRYAKKP